MSLIARTRGDARVCFLPGRKPTILFCCRLSRLESRSHRKLRGRIPHPHSTRCSARPVRLRPPPHWTLHFPL